MHTGSTSSTDVVVIGSGAGGAAVAGELARHGVNVVMLEAGPPGTGEHLRNADTTIGGGARFAHALEGILVPQNRQSSSPPRLPGLRGIHGVGGMLVGWTHNCPPPGWDELPAWIDRHAFAGLLDRTYTLLDVRTDLCNDDPRYEAIAKLLADRVGELPDDRHVQPMPTAVRREADGSWTYTGADGLLRGSGDRLTVIPDHVAREVLVSGNRAAGVRAHQIDGGSAIEIHADVVVIAAGTIGSAQLITASGIEAGPALGAFLTDHPLVATRVILREDLHLVQDANHFPLSIWIPGSAPHPWSTHVFQGFPLNFNPTLTHEVDARNSIDIFAFCPVDPVTENRLEFDNKKLDPFGLPTATGRVELSESDTEIMARAVEEIFLLSNDLADLVHGWSMQSLPRGSSMHLKGSCRMGVDDSDSVVSPEGRLWGYENCFVAGNAVLGESSSGNPTPVSVAFALHTADTIRGS